MPRQKPTIAFGPDIDLDKDVVSVGSERFTNADANRLADELSSRDRSLDNLIPGRKSLSGGSKHSPAVNIRVSEVTRRKLEQVAQQRGRTVSQIAREAIEEFLAR